MSDDRPAISVIGLGKLGAPMAAIFAERGFEVVAADVDGEKVRAINAGQAPVREPQLQTFIDEGRQRLRATADVGEAVRATAATFVIVPTPSDDDGRFSLKLVLPAMKAIGDALRHEDRWHLVVLTSTVMPGDTGSEVKAALEEASAKRCGVGFGLCYSPEFIALGSVIRDYLSPDLVLVGESDPRSGDELSAIYRAVVGDAPPVHRMRLAEAELTKIAINSFVTMKITFANLLAGICEQLPGARVDQVTDAVGADRRIGRRYLRGALPFGGPCFPRDNRALAVVAGDAGLPSGLAETTDATNRLEQRRLVDDVLATLQPGDTVAVLGLAYKPETDVIEESPGLGLAVALAEAGHPVLAWDPVASAAAARVLPSNVTVADGLTACVARADVIVLTTPDPAWSALADTTLTDGARVIDCWRLLDPKAIAGRASLWRRGEHGGRSGEGR